MRSRLANREMCLRIFSIVCLAVIAIETLADNQSCPGEKPFPRGSDACDRCDWKDVLEKYETGDLSVTRESEVFDHLLHVSVVYDKDSSRSQAL